MTITYPAMLSVDGLVRTRIPSTMSRVMYELDRDLDWYAPRWIAWLYRWLPHWISWRGEAFDSVTGRPYFLWSAWAPKWFIGWMPRRRWPAGSGRWGVLHLELLWHRYRMVRL